MEKLRKHDVSDAVVEGGVSAESFVSDERVAVAELGEADGLQSAAGSRAGAARFSSETATSANRLPYALEARRFSFAYPQGAAVFGPLDWRVPVGAFQLLVGSTGGGKTTLLKSFKPAIVPHGRAEGDLRLFGNPIDELDDMQAATLIGYVSQDPDNQIVCDSVWHELAFGLENIGGEQSVMRRRIAEVAHFFGIEPWFRRSVSELSGGQKQIVTLAATLALRPRILLLDEPTSQLDPVAEKSFLHALFRVNRELGITVVVATHAPEAMVAYATGVVRLENGKLCEADLADYAADFLSFDDESSDSPSPESVDSLPEAQSPESEVAASFGSSQSSSRVVPSGRQSAMSSRARALWAARRSKIGFGRCSSAKPAACVEASDLHVRYGRGDDWVLRGLDLTVRRGSFHALIGGNGCGKTTLLHTIAGSLKSERGSLDNTLQKKQALLPQDPKALFVRDSVDEELAEWQSACGYSNDDIEHICTWAGLEAFRDQHPYDLSGGQQQLLALAKMLLTKPDLLLLDEPTKGLDPHFKFVVAQKLRALVDSGTTIIAATHDLPFAALVSDYATMLFDGQAAATQPSAELFADNLFYRPLDDTFAKRWRAMREQEETLR